MIRSNTVYYYQLFICLFVINYLFIYYYQLLLAITVYYYLLIIIIIKQYCLLLLSLLDSLKSLLLSHNGVQESKVLLSKHFPLRWQKIRQGLVPPEAKLSLNIHSEQLMSRSQHQASC